jgi:hypothetical protein
MVPVLVMMRRAQPNCFAKREGSHGAGRAKRKRGSSGHKQEEMAQKYKLS